MAEQATEVTAEEASETTSQTPISAQVKANEEAGVPEKLNDSDPEYQSYWEKFRNFFPCLRHFEDLRRVHANNRIANDQYKYANNVLKTSKYNIITFLPINLLEQFLRIANSYFLLLVIIQSIPGITSVPVYTTLLPLLGVLAVTAAKDLFDDIKRHISDHRINTRAAHIVQGQDRIMDVKWKDVRVGDVLRLTNNDFITADLLLLSSSEPNGLVYIETAELDGETNLKVRQSLPETAEMSNRENLLGEFNGYVECEAPNNRLHKFVGKLIWNEEQYSLDIDKMLLRGCRLRNTAWMYGLVIYAGHDTKLVKNSGRTKFKRTRLDLMMNRMVLFILGFLAFLVSLTVIGSGIWEALYGVEFQAYVPFDSVFDSPAKIAFVQILSNTVVLNTFVPISLYVSVEVIRLGLSFLINWDNKMYYEVNDIPAQARTTTLNEELGQIEYIFSDKTGTLTQNIMTFRKCTINGVRYGDHGPEDSKPVDLKSWNVYAADDDFMFYDQKLIDICRAGNDPVVEEFFKLIALCHTVLPTQEDGHLHYNAQSPDEAALVGAAKNFGYAFTARTPFTVSVDLLNREQHDLPSSVNYEILQILDFNNERKRMSVIVKEPNTEKIILYCKGADTVLFERLDPSCDELNAVTISHLSEYATEGLRTLVLGMRELDIEEYEIWSEEYRQASLLAVDRDKEVDRVYNKIEQNLILLGATAIEDKLQDGVPETIHNLANANIKIWVLTGDKQETAINIGYSCKLLTEPMNIFIINAETFDGVMEQLQNAKNTITTTLECVKEGRPIANESKGPTGPPFGIVLNGHSLRQALKPEMELLLLDTATECKAVICCRVTPLQKKKVVDLVKANKKAVTLAIGDGANDVGMIKTAHIGVGISGLEGQQAVLSSDYSFGQFRYLERLLLVHGRWSYHRMSLFLKYFFYKNFAFAFSQFIFAFFCGFTAQTLYDPGFIGVYNVIYTSLPVLALGILDQDCSEESCLKYPLLYVAGQKWKKFNSWIFLISLIRGIIAAVILFFTLFGITYLQSYSAGYEWDYQSFSYAASGALILIVNFQAALDTNYWNPIIHIFIWGSMLSWLVVPPFLSNFYPLYITDVLVYWGVSNEVLASDYFWIYCFLATVLAIFPAAFIKILQIELRPALIDDVRLIEFDRTQKELKDKLVDVSHKLTTSIRVKEGEESVAVLPAVKPEKIASYRSSYAFSHEEGFGQLIATGRYLGADESKVAEERVRRNTLTLKRTPRSSSFSESSTSLRPSSSKPFKRSPLEHSATLPSKFEDKGILLQDEEDTMQLITAEVTEQKDDEA